MNVYVRVIERRDHGGFYEVVINNNGFFLKVDEQDLLNKRCGLEDFVVNSALDMAADEGYNRDSINIKVEGKLWAQK